MRFIVARPGEKFALGYSDPLVQMALQTLRILIDEAAQTAYISVRSEISRRESRREVEYSCQGEIDGLDKSQDRKSTRLNSSHLVISYAVFCLKKKKKKQ